MGRFDDDGDVVISGSDGGYMMEVGGNVWRGNMKERGTGHNETTTALDTGKRQERYSKGTRLECDRWKTVNGVDDT